MIVASVLPVALVEVSLLVVLGSKDVGRMCVIGSWSQGGTDNPMAS